MTSDIEDEDPELKLLLKRNVDSFSVNKIDPNSIQLNPKTAKEEDYEETIRSFSSKYIVMYFDDVLGNGIHHTDVSFYSPFAKRRYDKMKAGNWLNIGK